MTKDDLYRTPLATRYACKEMWELFSERKMITQWGLLCMWLAEAEQKLGIDIRDEQIDEMRRLVHDIDFQQANEEEHWQQHCIMTHTDRFAACCPNAAAIIHLGATSCYIVDNADLIILKEGMELVLRKLRECVKNLCKFAEEHKALPCLSLQHRQPAQLTTVGKRAILWVQDLLTDLENIERVAAKDIKFRGVKGSTGTQASFLQIFDGDQEKVEKLDALVSVKAGFHHHFLVTGQTYPRKLDLTVLSALAQLAASVHKVCADLRLLADMNEIEESVEANQDGSSAMLHKPNPMRSERCCSLARHVMTLCASPPMTEATLDDSAYRRLCLPEAFLATDGMLITFENVSRKLVVYKKMIEAHVAAELPYMVTEAVLGRMVQLGKGRRECQLQLKTLAHATGVEIKENGGPNDFLVRLRAEPFFSELAPELTALPDPARLIGRAPQQVDDVILSARTSIDKRRRQCSSGPSESGQGPPRKKAKSNIAEEALRAGFGVEYVANESRRLSTSAENLVVCGRVIRRIDNTKLVLFLMLDDSPSMRIGCAMYNSQREVVGMYAPVLGDHEPINQLLCVDGDAYEELAEDTELLCVLAALPHDQDAEHQP